MKNEEFQMDLIRAGILKNVVPLLRNAEAETSFWALVMACDFDVDYNNLILLDSSS